MMVKADYEHLWEAKQALYQPSFLSSLLQPSGRGGKVVIADYQRALRYLAEFEKALIQKGYSVSKPVCMQVTGLSAIKDIVHPCVWYALRLDSFCLCSRFSDLSEDGRNVILDSTTWMATEKIKGVRALLMSYTMGGSLDWFIFGRGINDDCSIIDYTPMIWSNHNFPSDTIIAVDVELTLNGTLQDAKSAGIDCGTEDGVIDELLSMSPDDARRCQVWFREHLGRDMLTFNVICPLYFGGRNYLHRPIHEGWDAYSSCVDMLCRAGVNARSIPRVLGSRFEKISFLDSILNRGGEGVVFHNGDAFYDSKGSRSKDVWIKLKHRIGTDISPQVLDDTFDVFVSGGSGPASCITQLDLSIICRDEDGREHSQLFAVLPLSGHLSQRATILDAGVARLNPEFMGMVAELQGCGLDKYYHLRNPQLIRFRNDKAASECIYDATYLRSLPRE